MGDAGCQEVRVDGPRLIAGVGLGEGHLHRLTDVVGRLVRRHAVGDRVEELEGRGGLLRIPRVRDGERARLDEQATLGDAVPGRGVRVRLPGLQRNPAKTLAVGTKENGWHRPHDNEVGANTWAVVKNAAGWVDNPTGGLGAPDLATILRDVEAAPNQDRRGLLAGIG